MTACLAAVVTCDIGPLMWRARGASVCQSELFR